MVKIDEIRVENRQEECVTDSDAPHLSFSLFSDRKGVGFNHAYLSIAGKEYEIREQVGFLMKGLPLRPFSKYEGTLCVFDDAGERADGKISFRTGRRDIPWTAKWITDKGYAFPKKTSPTPFTFRKRFAAKNVRRAYLTATALGIYELQLNGKKVGKQYFAPGFTSYKHTLQYDFYDVTALLKEENELLAVVGGGWAVGRFTYSSKSRITCDRQAFLCEVFLEYEDGNKEKVATDDSWQVTQGGIIDSATSTTEKRMTRRST